MRTTCSPHSCRCGTSPAARLILVPHEPSPEAVERVQRAAERVGAPTRAAAEHRRGRNPLVVVDRVGVLATLYGAGKLAYVGGGFGTAGLHSVLEPAAWGLPVIVRAQLGGEPRRRPACCRWGRCARRETPRPWPPCGWSGCRTTQPAPPWVRGLSPSWNRSEARQRGRRRCWTKWSSRGGRFVAAQAAPGAALSAQERQKVKTSPSEPSPWVTTDVPWVA